jgi:omega-3 fatty acid desaturase (delta-15 desaturase)
MAMEFPTLTEIKRALPRQCFEASVPLSMYFAARSLALAAALAASLAASRSLLPALGLPAWAAAALDASACAGYVLLQGVVFWGFFTVGHDCGHGAFSRFHALNWAVGTLMHSLILTPYEPWKLSHRHHHKNTGNIDRDEIFYPQRRKEQHELARHLVVSMGAAWFAYLLEGFPPRKVNHYNPWDPLFARRVAAVAASLAALGLCAAAYVALTLRLGLATMGLYYWAPLFVFGSLLVITTFLHHNDDETPWYPDAEWTYVKGNLSSVDRSYGPLVDNLSHHIGTHQVHHLFPIIPHYKLEEATAAFRAAFPHLARRSDAPIMASFFRIARLYAKFGVVPDADTPEGAAVFTLKDAQAQQQAQAKPKAV